MKINTVVYYIRAAVRFALFLVNNLYCFPTYGLWMLTISPLSYINPKLLWAIEGYFFKNLCLIIATWSWFTGYTWCEAGEDVSPSYHQECVVIANHQSTADVPTFMTVLQLKGKIINCSMWIMENILKYTNFGLVSAFRGDYFLVAGKDTRDNDLSCFGDHLRTVYPERDRKWIILFPEGGFLRKRREKSKKFAERNNLPLLEHVCLPRVGAFQTIINALHPTKIDIPNSHGTNHSVKKVKPLKWVVDVTIGYPNGVPTDLPAIIGRLKEPCKITLYYRRYPIEEVPTEMDAVTNWLYDRFVEKDALLDEFYKTGAFPPSSSPHSKSLETPRTIEFNSWWMAFIHVLFLLSSYFHYRVLKWIFRIMWPL